MKKTLVAFAVLAASGASFAQATITGNYTFGFKSETTAANAVTDGLHTDTAAVQFKASEDLGGGTTVSAQVSFGGAQRGGTLGGEDAFIQFAGGFGTIKAGSLESGIAGDVGTPGGGFGLDGSVMPGNVTRDSITYTIPAMGGFSLSASIADASSGAGAGGGGLDANTGAQATQSLTAAYNAGPLSVTGKYVNYKHKELGNNYAKNRIALKASYDLGVMSVGAGYGSTQYAATDASSLWQVGLSAPIGALTLGAKYGSSKDFVLADVAGAAGTSKKGYTLSADYAISKRTSTGAHFYSNSTDGVSGSNTGFRFLVGHSF